MSEHSAFPAIAIGSIGAASVQTVNARDLHAFLNSKKDFSTWIKDRIDAYGFASEIDFTTFEASPLNGGAGNRGIRIEYAVTIDMAKELSMVERNEHGKRARQYFIECEKRAKAPATVDLNDPATLRGLLANYADKDDRTPEGS
jgi:anti-repressor protein